MTEKQYKALLEAVNQRNKRFDKVEEKLDRIDNKLTNHSTNLNWIKAVGGFSIAFLLAKIFGAF
ncbi:MAG: hypothetical protein OXE55_04825 [Flavobacteriaceae bacterium]|nr:hypothetical protein [Flavobacteriaceae bacterium]